VRRFRRSGRLDRRPRSDLRARGRRDRAVRHHRRGRRGRRRVVDAVLGADADLESQQVELTAGTRYWLVVDTYDDATAGPYLAEIAVVCTGDECCGDH